MSSRTIRSDERGIALVIALFMTMMVSALAASMAYVARTETLSSQSYTTMAHARYGAESGLAAATNYLLSTPYAVTAPGTGADPLTNYDTNVSPVRRANAAVVLSSVGGRLELPGQCRRHGVWRRCRRNPDGRQRHGDLRRTRHAARPAARHRQHVRQHRDPAEVGDHRLGQPWRHRLLRGRGHRHHRPPCHPALSLRSVCHQHRLRRAVLCGRGDDEQLQLAGTQRRQPRSG